MSLSWRRDDHSPLLYSVISCKPPRRLSNLAETYLQDALQTEVQRQLGQATPVLGIVHIVPWQQTTHENFEAHVRAARTSHVLHIHCHVDDGSIRIADANEQERLIHPAVLCDLLTSVGEVSGQVRVYGVECLVVTGCNSDVVVKAVAPVVPFAVGSKRVVSVWESMHFSSRFLTSLLSVDQRERLVRCAVDEGEKHRKWMLQPEGQDEVFVLLPSAEQPCDLDDFSQRLARALDFLPCLADSCPVDYDLFAEVCSHNVALNNYFFKFHGRQVDEHVVRWWWDDCLKSAFCQKRQHHVVLRDGYLTNELLARRPLLASLHNYRWDSQAEQVGLRLPGSMQLTTEADASYMRLEDRVQLYQAIAEQLKMWCNQIDVAHSNTLAREHMALTERTAMEGTALIYLPEKSKQTQQIHALLHQRSRKLPGYTKLHFVVIRSSLHLHCAHLLLRQQQHVHSVFVVGTHNGALGSVEGRCRLGSLVSEEQQSLTASSLASSHVGGLTCPGRAGGCSSEGEPGEASLRSVQRRSCCWA